MNLYVFNAYCGSMMRVEEQPAYSREVAESKVKEKYEGYYSKVVFVEEKKDSVILG